MTKVGRALLSVHDKTGVVDFAKGLSALGIEIVSTGGTAKLLRESGVPVVDVAQLTGFPEMLDGRVKTLHPKVHGGILARRDVPAHMQARDAHGIGPVDLVVVALYPSEQTVARPGVTLDEAVENIDIGGPSMIRGAAKNSGAVGVITDPSQYAPVLDELRGSGGTLTAETRSRLALEAFRRTAQYDAAIASYLGRIAAGPESGGDFPVRLSLEAERLQHLRYGENPHQAAAFYRPVGTALGLGAAEQLHGPELSYNNLLDWSAALGLLVQEADLTDLDPAALKVVSRRAPTEAEMQALRFAWRVAKHAKSNAIVLTTADQVVGVGAGQMNRVDSARIAVMRARANGLETKGAVCASDAFFPFRDGLDVVAEAGATAVIHPGGSLRDEEVVKAADEHGLAMVVCGIRHFKH